jgi:hypothetical protein
MFTAKFMGKEAIVIWTIKTFINQIAFLAPLKIIIFFVFIHLGIKQIGYKLKL